MEVPYRVEEPIDVAEGLVRADTLEMSLPQPLRVVLVIAIWPTEHLLAVPFDKFFLDPWLALIILDDAKAVARRRKPRRLAKLHVQLNRRVSPRGKTAYLRDAAAVRNRFLQTAARSRNVAQETERIEEVGFPAPFGPAMNTRCCSGTSMWVKFRQFSRAMRVTIIRSIPVAPPCQRRSSHGIPLRPSLH